MSDSGPKLGKLLSDPWQPRDAIHVAVIPVESGDDHLRPGQHVGLTANGKATGTPEKCIGVVDPFLPPGRAVGKGECFWLMLYPGTTTSMQHEWSHPAFPAGVTLTAEEKAESEAWLSKYIGEWFVDSSYTERKPMYKEVISSILRGGRGTIYGREEREASTEFWFHLERLIGRQISSSMRENTYFDCMC